jgi:HEAT repeat protein
VRAAAIFAIRRCRASVDPTPLAGMLQDASPRVRAQAAFVLGELGDAGAIPMLREAARDPMNKAPPSEVKVMQLQIAEARIKLGDDDALQELRAALYPARPEDMEATILAAQIIGQVQDRASMAPLIALTAMKDEAGNRMPAEAQLAAAGSLARLGATQGGFIARQYSADPDPIRRAQAAFVFGETGGRENLPILDGMLADQEGTVRVSAAAAILKIAEAATAMGQNGR